MSDPWPDEDIVLLKKMWAEGSSDSQIARELGGRHSRNAVVGMRHRKKIERDPSFVRVRTASRTSSSRPKPYAPELTREEVVPVAVRPTQVDGYPTVDATPPPSATAGAVTTSNLEPHHCRWIADDGTYCGAQRVDGRPYCEEHCAAAYAPSRPLTGVRPSWRVR